jgi:hypothetical protein
MFISVWTLHCVEKFLSSLHPSEQVSNTSGRLLVLDQLQILSNFKYGKTNSIVWTTWYTVQTSVSLGLDVRATNMEIANSISTVRTIASHGPDARIADMEIAY